MLNRSTSWNTLHTQYSKCGYKWVIRSTFPSVLINHIHLHPVMAITCYTKKYFAVYTEFYESHCKMFLKTLTILIIIDLQTSSNFLAGLNRPTNLEKEWVFTFYVAFITCCVLFFNIFFHDFRFWITVSKEGDFFLMLLSWLCLFGIFAVLTYYKFLRYATTFSWFYKGFFYAIMKRSQNYCIYRKFLIFSKPGSSFS